MPTVYLPKHLYDEIIKRHLNVSEFVNKSLDEALKQLKEKQGKGKSPAK